MSDARQFRDAAGALRAFQEDFHGVDLPTMLEEAAKALENAEAVVLARMEAEMRRQAPDMNRNAVGMHDLLAWFAAAHFDRGYDRGVATGQAVPFG